MNSRTEKTLAPGTAAIPKPIAPETDDSAQRNREVLSTRAEPHTAPAQTLQWREGTFVIHMVTDDLLHTRMARREGLVSLDGNWGVDLRDSDKVGDHYFLTHLPTGWCVHPGVDFANRAKAQLYCAKLVKLADWSKVTPENPPSIGETVQQLISEYGRRTKL